MSHTIEANTSDDEFYDAHTDDPAAGRETIDELIEKQCGLNLSEEAEQGATAAEASATDATATTTESTTNSPPECLDEDDIDEAALTERDKTLSEEELQANKMQASELKLNGNDLFKRDLAEEAIEVYHEALKICPMKFTHDRAILYGNRAAAKVKVGSKKSAVDDCSKAIELWPEYVRALLRRAKLYEYDDKLDEALEDYKRVHELDPGQSEAGEAMVRLPPIIQERNEKLKTEMMSKLKDLGNMFLKPFGLSTSNFQMQQDPNTGSYSINFNQNNAS